MDRSTRGRRRACSRVGAGRVRMIHPAFRVDGGCVGAHEDLRGALLGPGRGGKRRRENEENKVPRKNPGRRPRGELSASRSLAAAASRWCRCKQCPLLALITLNQCDDWYRRLKMNANANANDALRKLGNVIPKTKVPPRQQTNATVGGEGRVCFYKAARARVARASSPL